MRLIATRVNANKLQSVTLALLFFSLIQNISVEGNGTYTFLVCVFFEWTGYAGNFIGETGL